MNNNHVPGDMTCPEDIPGMMTSLNDCRDGGGRKKINEIRDGIVGSGFAQMTSGGKKHVECFACGKCGHIARDCPDAENDGEEESTLGESATLKKGTQIGWTGTQMTRCNKAEEWLMMFQPVKCNSEVGSSDKHSM